MVGKGTVCDHVVKAQYLLGSKHVSKHRKQTSITDAKTHAVLPQNLELTQQVIREQPFLLIHSQRLAVTYAAQCPDVALCTPSVVEFTETWPSPNQVSLAGTTRPRGKSLSLSVLLAEDIHIQTIQTV